jgi:hypothetical protein
MATSLTLPIARLRAAGCKVSTIIGHDPNIGDYLYKVTLPKGIPGHYQLTIGQATLRSRPVAREVVIRSARYRIGQPIPDRQERNAAGVEAARLFESLADHVDTFDQEGSASRQHYIDTGRYLTHPEREEYAL